VSNILFTSLPVGLTMLAFNAVFLVRSVLGREFGLRP
jgi:hypothetical protein